MPPDDRAARKLRLPPRATLPINEIVVVGKVVATLYNEIVVERVYEGKKKLVQCLPSLVEAAEQTLELDERKRQHTILRIDSGGGSVANVNDMLARGYHFHGKDYSAPRVQVLVKSVTEWVDDPKEPGRQFG